MMKKIFIFTALIFWILPLLGQKRLQITEKNMSGVIFREAGDNETVVEVQSNVPLDFESTMDKQVNVYKKKQEGSFFYYKLKFPTGTNYKGRRLTIKSYGFFNCDYPLELQAKVSVGLLVSDPEIKVEMDIVTLKNGKVVFALVQEVGMEDIKYKRYDNPTGPVYTMKRSEIFMVTYANGSKDIFSEEAKPTTDKDVSEPEPSGLKSYDVNNICIIDTKCGVQIMCYDLQNKMTWNDAKKACPSGYHLPALNEIQCICKEHSPNYRVGFSYIKVPKNYGEKTTLQISQDEYWTSSVEKNKPITITTNDCHKERRNANNTYYVRCVKD